MALKIGDKVSTSASVDVNGTHLASFVRNNVYEIIQIGGQNYPDSRVVIGKDGKEIAAVDINTLVSFPEKSLKSTYPVPTPMQVPANPEDEIDAQSFLGDMVNGAKNTISNIKNGVDKLQDQAGNWVGSKIDSYVGTGAGKALVNGVMNLGKSLLSSAVSSLFGSLKSWISNSIFGDSRVMYLAKRYKTTQNSDYQYTYTEKQSADYYAVMNMLKYGDLKYQQSSVTINALDRNAPSVVQNKYGFPNKTANPDSAHSLYRYDYFMDYEKEKLLVNMNTIRQSVNIDLMDPTTLYRQYTKYYNKYKQPNGNDSLSKTFAHVFFVRPDCNIYAEGSNGGLSSPALSDDLKNLSEYYYALKHCPEMLRELTQSKAGYNHQFALYLSNKAKSFQTADEYIDTDAYGQALTGHKVAYGKSNIKSKTEGSFQIKYVDDRDLHIYHLHKLWSDYVSHVYRGKVMPNVNYIKNRILDYATCVYYILTAEDGETIIFWSKYYGVFPVTMPSSSFAYDSETRLANPEYSVEYRFSWKEDFNPLSLIEFNTHSPTMWQWRYVNKFQPAVCGTGYTWSGIPFIETFNGDGKRNLPYTFKLRFRPMR